jgi:GNAT superfamily N-acetyltransferase
MDKPPAPMLRDYGPPVEAGTTWVTGSPLTAVLTLCPRDDHVYVENIAVDPGAQGRGLGRALMEFAEQEAGLPSRRGPATYLHGVSRSPTRRAWGLRRRCGPAARRLPGSGVAPLLRWAAVGRFAARGGLCAGASSTGCRSRNGHDATVLARSAAIGSGRSRWPVTAPRLALVRGSRLPRVRAAAPSRR